jgi:hypothetical protein
MLIMKQTLDSQPPGLLSNLATVSLRLLAIIATAAGTLSLLASAYLISREGRWLPPPPRHLAESDDVRNQRAFFHGTIGTEVVPLPVLKVLPELCPEHFYPFGKDAGSWIEQFGFLPSALAPETAPAEPLAKDLPLGFTLSHYRPKSGAPSPVLFVGLACATCHTTKINKKLVIGTGNTSLNLFAWIDAFQASLLDPRVTYGSVMEKYESDPTNPQLSREEKAMIWLWLSGARSKQEEDVSKYDEPHGWGLSMLPANVPTGPCRTQPFRTLVRGLLHRPGADMKVYTKIAAVYLERQEEWGQFDGGIHGLYRRSAGAAFAAGATAQNMSLPEIANNIKWASDYIGSHGGPKWNEIFPDQPVVAASKIAISGKDAYLRHCDSCHGHPEGDVWKPGTRDGKLIYLTEIKTDPERITFRGYEEIPDVLADYFPKDHPFDFPRDSLRPPPRLNRGDLIIRGYINKRMHSMFSRAPFLHNGSVLTLAELINLEERRPLFYRGANAYDTQRLGLNAPTGKEHVAKDHRQYFAFDTAVLGNSNQGHDYPWKWEEVRQDPQKQNELRALLEYLKTL